MTGVGEGANARFVTSLHVGHRSSEESEWMETTLVGNNNSESIRTHLLGGGEPIEARFVRLRPAEWHNEPALRVELFSRYSPQESRLTQNLAESAFTCSSQATPLNSPFNSRILQHLGNGGWLAAHEDETPFLQIDLGSMCHVSHVASQGRSQHELMNYIGKDLDDAWVTSYTLSMSPDLTTWTEPQVCNGNVDGSSLVFTTLEAHPDYLCRYIRVFPQSWNGLAVMRFEAFGSSVGLPLGMQSECIADDQLSATSKTSAGPPKCGRLGSAAAWRPNLDFSNGSPSIVVKLKGRARLTGLATLGGEVDGEVPAGWLQSYSLEVSDNGTDWGRSRRYHGNTDASGQSHL